MNTGRPYQIGLVCLVRRRGTPEPRNGPRDAAAAPGVGKSAPEGTGRRRESVARTCPGTASVAGDTQV